LSEHFRRIDPRYDRQLRVEVSCDGKEYVCRSRNMSLGGMHLDCAGPLPIGATATLRFQIPTQPELIEVAGDVRWVAPLPDGGDQVGIGIRFQGLRARDVWALNRFFQSAS
jgi:Tfp pilus assembly protein PilZ